MNWVSLIVLLFYSFLCLVAVSIDSRTHEIEKLTKNTIIALHALQGTNKEEGE